MQVHGPCTTCDVVTDHDSSNNLSCVVNMSLTPREKKRTSLNAVGPSVLLRRLLGFLITLDQSSFLVIYGGSYFYYVMRCPVNDVNVLMIAFFALCYCRLLTNWCVYCWKAAMVTVHGPQLASLASELLQPLDLGTVTREWVFNTCLTQHR